MYFAGHQRRGIPLEILHKGVLSSKMRISDRLLKQCQTDWVRWEKGRLAYYKVGDATDATFWDRNWTGFNLNSSFYDRYQRGWLVPYHVVFPRHLPRDGIILEAGCGLAQIVVALRGRGYDCRGIDYAQETISQVRACLPDLPVEMGDVRHLNFNDEELSAYISIGVVEHFQEGPMEVLCEAARVLRPQGILIISIPQVHPWRERNIQPEGSPLPPGANFYQYAFPPDEFSGFLTAANFEIDAEYGFGVHFALRNRFGWFRAALEHFPKLAYVDLILDQTRLGCRMGRMRMWVARKRKS